MKANNPNKRPLPFNTGRAMTQAKPGGLMLPAAEAAEIAQKEAAKWKPVMLSWCPIFGPFVVHEGSKPVMKPHPIMPPRTMPDGTVQHAHCPWILCPHCGELHMVAGVLTEAKEGDPAALSADEVAPTPPADDADVSKMGRATGEEAVFVDLACFQVQRVDSKGPEGHLAGLVVTAMNKDFEPCKTADDGTAVIEVTIDGADKADLQRRVMLWVDGLRETSGKPAMFGGTAYCKRLWAARED